MYFMTSVFRYFIYFEGDQSIGAVDWSGVKLIYQEHIDGNWYLSGIIHCERIM